MFFSFPQIIQGLIYYKYWILLPIVVVEGPIITIISGFLSSLGYLNVFVAYGVIVFGDLAGDILYYATGRWGRSWFLDRWGHYIGITTDRIKQMEAHFENHSGKTLIVGKLSHAIGGVILVTAGVAKVPFWKFVWFNFIATLPKTLILLLIGFYFGQAYAKFGKYLDYTAFATVALAVLFVIIYLVMKKSAKHTGNL